MSGTDAQADHQAQAVVDYLIVAWRQVFRLTTAGQALAALGLAPDPALRVRVADLLDASPERSPIIRRWGVPALVLTGDEKLLGRALERAGESVTVEALARRRGVAAPALCQQLALLSHCGLVAEEAGGYRLVAGWRERLGPLGWACHEVQPEGEPAYTVPCAVDFLLLARHAYPERQLTVTDSCAWSDTPIRATIAHGAVRAVDPVTTLVFPGGG